MSSCINQDISSIEPSPRLLVVDDDTEIRDLLRILLSKHGYVVLEAESGADMFRILAQDSVDMVLLDIMLHDSDGLEICKRIRATSNLPIIMISAMGEPSDRVLGLEFGADDYIAKPFYSREVVARVKALLRRRKLGQKIKANEKTIYFSGWTLHRKNRRLFDSNQVEISLSSGEYILLEILLEHANRIITRDQLLSHIHAHQEEVFDRSIDVQICRLRKRIEMNPEKPILIKTVRGKGYLFEVEIEEKIISDKDV